MNVAIGVATDEDGNGCQMKANEQKSGGTIILDLPSLTGRSLKHFRIDGLLGRGGMGMVYRAQDTKLHRPVAVKLLAPELTSDPQRRQRFLLEARAAARISHPAIAQIYYVDEQDDVIFIVMELVEGKTVRELIRDKELDLLGAMDIAVQVAGGLAKAHELCIVHRDIKPANVMLNRDRLVKILDFGLAKLLDYDTAQLDGEVGSSGQARMAQTHVGDILGTPAYMSPEQVRGVPVDFRADIFSMGVLLFEMACGQSPFVRDNTMATMNAVAFDEAPSMHSIQPHVPLELQRVVSRCLRKRPEDRYPNAGLLLEDLKRLRRDTETGLAQQTSWQHRLAEAWERLRHLPRSKMAWIGLGAGGLLFAGYLSASEINAGPLVLLTIGVLIVYRYVRNQAHRVQELFVRRASKIPEVRVVVFRDRQATVVIDRPVAQLYGRLNDHLRTCNRKLLFGAPMTLVIQEEISTEEMRKTLCGPGVQYVREDVTPIA